LRVFGTIRVNGCLSDFIFSGGAPHPSHESNHEMGKRYRRRTVLRFLVSLTVNDDDYQTEQAIAAGEAARRLGVAAEILYAENDSITQSQQLLKAINASKNASDARWRLIPRNVKKIAKGDFPFAL
jgi:hypothetical protein